MVGGLPSIWKVTIQFQTFGGGFGYTHLTACYFQMAHRVVFGRCQFDFIIIFVLFKKLYLTFFFLFTLR